VSERPRLVTAICLCLLACSGASGEPAKKLDRKPAPIVRAGRPYARTQFFRRVWEDQRYLVRSWWPAESRRAGFSIPLVLALAGASESASQRGGFDRRWQRGLEGWTGGERREVARSITQLGDAQTATLLLGSSYLLSRWAGAERLRDATSLSAEALVSTTLYTELLKRIARRARPAGANTGRFFVSRPAPGEEPTSFPSGHASGAFAVATVLAGEFHDRRWVSWVAYGTATLVAASRVGLGRHFPSDVLAGAVLGHSVGRMVVHLRRGGDDRSGWGRVVPLVEPEHGGFGVAYRRRW